MKERILKVMKAVFELENTDETISQKNCEKWDSLNHLQLVIALEEEFDISFEPEEITEMKDFQTIESIIAHKNIQR
ncbi:MAG: acyl carrier protein [Bacteroidales bacterium]|jgi:acyl carrier protein|nr:acyl carrier protein [Bacteroidales bacterium]